MKNVGTHTIINEQNGNLAFKIISFIDNSHFDYFQRNNFHTLVLITEGDGELQTAFGVFKIAKKSFFAFAPYQPFMIKGKNCQGIAVQFHSDFFCIHKHQTEVTCNGVLFNNVHQLPLFEVDYDSFMSFQELFVKIANEINNSSVAQYEMLVSYLKIILITSSRIKLERLPANFNSENNEAEVLQKLKEFIEENFKSEHFSEFYSAKLFTTPKGLTKLLKKYYSKTFTQLITERLLIEAKRELYLTKKSVKEITAELGYNDEHYFSRFFKKNTGITTQQYRETVGFAKKEE
ncbi:MAG: helix-turn-helix domain-containing protein [Ginsengibacter sp.]